MTQTLLNKLGNVHRLNTSGPFALFLFLDFELLNFLKKPNECAIIERAILRFT